MKVKNIHLHGFKSFASPTRLEFDAGLAAVVGPNGSGKSNLVEAVRWVLGEQSPSQLRSKRTEDFIWAGGSGRAQAGMAEVAITFDNSDRSLPLPFDEVTIARRAYRSGENEYLINRSRVRLRDVSELTSAIGLSYTVVSQGTADAALSLTPEGRRALFEEAADITQHYMRRDEAVRRMTEMEQNSLRVQDLLAELEPRLRALARQARQVREQQTEQERLRNLLVAHFAGKLRGTDAELASAERNLERAAQEHATCSSRLAELDTQQARLQAEEAEVAASMRRLQSALVEARTQAAEAERRVIPAEGEVARLNRELTGGRDRLAAALAAAQAYEDELSQLAAAGSALRRQHEAVAARLRDARAAEAAASQNHSSAAQTAEALRNEQFRCHQEVSRARNRLATLVDRLDALQRELRQHTDDHRQHDERASSALVLLAAAEREQRERRTALDEAHERVNELRRRSRELDAEVPQAGARVTETEVQLRSLRQRLVLLQEMEHSGAGLSRSVQSVMKWAAEGRLSGVHGTLASLLEVPAEYEQAVESALGGALQNIVVSEWGQAERAIKMLKSAGAGRTTFLPLDTLRPAARPHVPQISGVVGLAADLVRYPAGVEKAAAHSLGRVLIVTDLRAARATVGAVAGVSAVVTLEGETVRPGGALTGGSPVRESGMLARQRELRDLPAGVVRAEQAVTDARARLKQLQTEQARGAEVERAAADRLRQRQQAVELAEGRLREAQREHERLVQLGMWSSASRERLDADIKDIEERTAETRARLAALESEAAGSRDALGRAVAAESETRRAQTEASRDAARLQTEEAVLRERLGGEERRTHRLSELLEKARGQVNRLASESAGTEEAYARASEELRSASARAALARASLAERDAAVAPLQDALALLRESQRSHEAHRRTGADSLLKAEESRLTLVLAVERLHEQRELLCAQARAQTGLDEIPVDTAPIEDIDRQIRLSQERMARIGMVNPLAAEEYEDLRSRADFLHRQLEDIQTAQNDLRAVIAGLETQMTDRFAETFTTVSERFDEYFRRLFNGGSARLALVTRGDSVGVEIQAQPPGKRLGSLSLLSGGERALSSCALIFALIQTSRSPFSVLDEVDAALDESNVGRFCDLLEELGKETQFIVVTHNRGTIERAGRLYGLSMEPNGASRVLGLRLEDVEQVRATA